MKEIPLTQGTVALVDDEDFDALAAFKWCASRSRNTFYATRGVHRPDGRWTTEQMHRVVFARKLGRALTDGVNPDHENRNGLDNRRENLREATVAQNRRNCRRHSANPASQYLGVTWRKYEKKWQAQIGIARECIYLGCYATELAAAQAREAFITAHPELRARSNFTHGAP